MKSSLLELPDQTSGDGGLGSSGAQPGADKKGADFEGIAKCMAEMESADVLHLRIIDAERTMPAVQWAELITSRPDGTLTCGVKAGCSCRALESDLVRDAVRKAQQGLFLEQVVLPADGGIVLVLPLATHGEADDVLVLGLGRTDPPNQAALRHFTSFAGLAAQLLELGRHDRGLLGDHKILESAITRRTEELEKQREFDRVLLENLETGVVACDQTGRLVLFNRASREWHGLGPLSSIPMEEWSSFYDLYKEDGVAPLPSDRIPLVRAFRGEEVHGARMVIKPKESGPRLVCVSATRLRANDGSLLGAVALMEDITEFTETAHKLRETSEYLNNLLEYANAPIIVWDKDYRITIFNRAFESLTGLPAKEAIGSDLGILFPEAKREATLDYIRSTAGQRWETVEIDIVRADGAISTLLWNSATLHDPATNAAVATIAQGQNITRRKEAEQEIRAANTRLHEMLQRTEELARKAELANEAKSDFLATMSHELRTPMNGVLGMADVLDLTQLDAEQRSCLDLIRSSGESLLALINSILDFSKIEAGQLDLEFHDFELGPFIKKLADTYTATAAAKGLSFRLECDERAPAWVNSDSGRLQQVLANLLNNAVKFTEEGGITLSVSCGDEEHDWISLRFAVRDTGVGVPPDKRNLLFRRFSQLDYSETRKHGGTGLGLAICKQLVELFGGSIGVNSPPANTAED